MENVNSQENISIYLKNHFNNLREKQKQNRDLTSLTEDLKFTISFVNNSTTLPVPLLKLMGIICFKEFLALNINLLQPLLTIYKIKIIPNLLKEGWKEFNLEKNDFFISLIGINQIKNWTFLKFPNNSEILNFFEKNLKLIANEKNIFNFNSDINENHVDALFPLVSIQYERVIDSFNIIDHKPLKNNFKFYNLKFSFNNLYNLIFFFFFFFL